MAKEAVFTMKLEPELRDAFMAAAKKEDLSASQLARRVFREYLEATGEPDEAYWDFVRRKVERSRRDVAEGRVYTNDEVNAHMEQLLADLERKSAEVKT